MRLDEYQIANALIDTRLVTSRHGARIPDNIFIIDPNPVTSPRKPIHGLRDCVFLNFRVGRHSGVADKPVALAPRRSTSGSGLRQFLIAVLTQKGSGSRFGILVQ
jgi:hypothetical protein